MNNREEQKHASIQSASRAWLLLFVAWLVVTVAMLTSLFLSEVMDVPVCQLCWYQRIALYPMVPILALALFPYDPGVVRYATALSVIGWLLSMYHVLLVAGVIPETVQPCEQGIPCSETHIAWLGFLNVPVLSLLTFTVVGVLLFLVTKVRSK